MTQFGTTGCRGMGSDRKLLDLNCEAGGNDGIQFGGGTPALYTTGLLSNAVCGCEITVFCKGMRSGEGV